MCLLLRMNCWPFQDKRGPIQSISSSVSVASRWTFSSGSLGKWESTMLVPCMVSIPTTTATRFMTALRQLMTGAGCQSTGQVILSVWLFSVSSVDFLWQMLTFDALHAHSCVYPHASTPDLLVYKLPILFNLPSRPLANWPCCLPLPMNSYIF